MYDHLKRCTAWYDTFMYIIIFFHQNPILKSMQLDFKVLWYIIPQVWYLKSKILLSKPEAEFKELQILFLKGRKNMIVSDPPSKKSNTWLTTVPLIKYELYINVLFVSTVYFHLRVFCKSDLRAFSAFESPNGKTHGTKNFKVRVRKTTISSIFIIRLRFQEYHFKSGIVFLAQNYTHGPLITLTVH